MGLYIVLGITMVGMIGMIPLVRYWDRQDARKHKQSPPHQR